LASAAVILLICAAVLKASKENRKHAVMSERGDFIEAGASVRERIIRLGERSIDSGYLGANTPS